MQTYILRVTTLLFLFALLSCAQLRAQELTLNGYVDGYFSYTTDSVPTTSIEQFQTVGVEPRSFGVNVARLAAAYSDENMRANFAFFLGDIPKYNWQGNIQDANVGFRLFKGKPFWFDIGYFSTHIGTEVLLPRDNITSRLALGTQFEPFFHGGACLSYEGEKLYAKIMLNNGYYSFYRAKPNLSVGAIVSYEINDRLKVGYSNQSGNEYVQGSTVDMFGANSLYSARIYNNLWISYTGEKFDILAGGDFGLQQNASLGDTVMSETDPMTNETRLRRLDEMASVMSGLAAFRFHITERYAVYAKAEYLSDPDAILTYHQGMTKEFEEATDPDITKYGRGLQAMGLTLGFQVRPTDKSYIRLEGQYLNALNDQGPFYRDGGQQSSRIGILLNAGISFDSGNLIK